MNFLSALTSKTLMARLSGDSDSGGSGGLEQNEPSDLDLVTKAQSGDYAAFDLLVTRHRAKVYAMVKNMVKNEADAWDLAQDVFIKVWKNLGKFENRAKFTTWLYRVAHNVVYDWLRKKKISAENEFDDQLLRRDRIEANSQTTPAEDVAPDQALERAELRTRIQQAIHQLSPDHRQVILLREVQGMDYKEIAEIAEISLGTVMSRLFYARKKLQALLSDVR